MTQYYLINTQNIKQHLLEMDKEDTERTLCGLDFLLNNINDNLLDVLQGASTLMIEVNHNKKEVTLLGNTLPSEHWKIIFDQERNNETIYSTFIDAINVAKQTEWWDNLIKEIKST